VSVLEELSRIRTIVVVSVVIMAIGVTAIGLAPLRPDGSIDTRVSDLILTVAGPLSVLAWFSTLIAHRVLFYRRLGSYEARDASQAPVVPTPRLYAQGVALAGLGFESVGQLEYRWPWQRWKMAWIFTNPAYRVDAAVGLGREPSFSSHWADGSGLATTRGWPARMLNVPGTRLISTSGITEAVFARHLQQADEYGQGHGERMPTSSMADVLAHEAAEVPCLRDIMRAVWMRPSVVVILAFGAGLMLVLIASGLRII
jgi:hypothetical protein